MDTMSRRRSVTILVRFALLPLLLWLAASTVSVPTAPGQATRPSAGPEAPDAAEPPGGGPAVARTSRAVLTVQAERFLLDGRPFDMWGIRTASGTQDDAQCDHLLAQLDEYKAHGVNTVTVFYMGCPGASYDPFSPDGRRLDPGHQGRMERIIRACAGRGMVVVVGLFYQAAPLGLRDAEAVRTAVRTVTTALRPHRNVLINIANEQNSGGWADSAAIYDFRDPQRIIELCRLVHEVDPERLVGGGGYDHEKNLVIGRSPEVDVLLFDTAGPDLGSGELHDRFVAGGVRASRSSTSSCSAAGRSGSSGASSRRRSSGCIGGRWRRRPSRPGLSVFFHNNPWCQQEPMRYDLGGSGSEADPGIRWYFEHVRGTRGGSAGPGGEGGVEPE